MRAVNSTVTGTGTGSVQAGFPIHWAVQSPGFRSPISQCDGSLHCEARPWASQTRTCQETRSRERRARPP